MPLLIAFTCHATSQCWLFRLYIILASFTWCHCTYMPAIDTLATDWLVTLCHISHTATPLVDTTPLRFHWCCHMIDVLIGHCHWPVFAAAVRHNNTFAFLSLSWLATEPLAGHYAIDYATFSAGHQLSLLMLLPDTGYDCCHTYTIADVGHTSFRHYIDVFLLIIFSYTLLVDTLHAIIDYWLLPLLFSFFSLPFSLSLFPWLYYAIAISLMPALPHAIAFDAYWCWYTLSILLILRLDALPDCHCYTWPLRPLRFRHYYATRRHYWFSIYYFLSAFIFAFWLLITTPILSLPAGWSLRFFIADDTIVITWYTVITPLLCCHIGWLSSLIRHCRHTFHIYTLMDISFSDAFIITDISRHIFFWPLDGCHCFVIGLIATLMSLLLISCHCHY